MGLLSERAAGLIAGRLVLNFAAMAFLGVTLFLTWQGNAWALLFTLPGLAYLLCGLAFAGGIIGALPAHLHSKLARWVLARCDGEPGPREAAMIRSTGTFVLLCQLLLVYYLTLWAYDRWVLPAPV